MTWFCYIPVRVYSVCRRNVWMTWGSLWIANDTGTRHIDWQIKPNLSVSVCQLGNVCTETTWRQIDCKLNVKLIIVIIVSDTNDYQSHDLQKSRAKSVSVSVHSVTSARQLSDKLTARWAQRINTQIITVIIIKRPSITRSIDEPSQVCLFIC